LLFAFQEIQEKSEHCEGHQAQYAGNQHIEFLFGIDGIKGRSWLFNEISFSSKCKYTETLDKKYRY